MGASGLAPPSARVPTHLPRSPARCRILLYCTVLYRTVLYCVQCAFPRSRCVCAAGRRVPAALRLRQARQAQQVRAAARGGLLHADGRQGGRVAGRGARAETAWPQSLGRQRSRRRLSLYSLCACALYTSVTAGVGVAVLDGRMCLLMYMHRASLTPEPRCRTQLPLVVCRLWQHVSSWDMHSVMAAAELIFLHACGPVHEGWRMHVGPSDGMPVCNVAGAAVHVHG